MNLQTEKYLAIHQILQVNDEMLINTIRSLLDFGLKAQENDSAEAVTDFWDELSEKEQASIELSMKQLDEGKGIPHEDVMSEFRAKYKR
jgi:hypothetical protein